MYIKAQEKLDYWVEISKIANGSILDNHDCHLSREGSCKVCEDILQVKEELATIETNNIDDCNE